jgi:hypothetical protein
MSAGGNVELGAFERRLLTELRGVVVEHARNRTAQPVRPRRAFPRRSVAAALAVAAAACVAALIAFSSGSSPSLAQAFPILGRPGTGIPSTLASFLRSGGVSAQRARLDVRHARAFRTPLGTGYVLTDRDAKVICVAAPGFDHHWGGTCGSAAAARRQGVGGLETFSARSASFVDVLPQGATATIRVAGGPARATRLHDGVLAFLTSRPTSVTTRIDGHATTVRILVPTRPARAPVPSRAQVATPVRLRIAGDMVTATFRARYPARRGASAYVLETDERSGGATSSEDGGTTGNVRPGQLVRLRGGLPEASGPVRVTVFYAAPTGAVRQPCDWPPVLGDVTRAPTGSGAQIVATRVIVVRLSTSRPTVGVGRGPRTSRSGG